MSGPNSEQQHLIELIFDHEVNDSWLEETAIRIEESLIQRMHGKIHGPSVTANFDRNAFEIDVTVVAETNADA